MVGHYNLVTIITSTGLKAAEIIHKRADAGKPNLGATSWKGRKVLKRDIGTAKNYPDHREIDTLNRITVMFLDQAEFRALRRQDIHMGDWEVFLDKFLTGTELPVLEGSDRISPQDALDNTNQQYAAFAERRRTAVEAEAEAHCVDDLRASPILLDDSRKQAGKKTGGNGEDGRGRT